MMSILPYLNKYGSRDYMKVLVGVRIYGVSVERLEVAASGLSLVMSTFPFPVLIGQERKKRNQIQRKRRKKRQKIRTTKGRKKNKQRRKNTT